jgi:hypothetical protein
MLREEIFREIRLGKDQKCYDLTQEFRVLLPKGLTLRYGDYHKTNVFTLKWKC